MNAQEHFEQIRKLALQSIASLDGLDIPAVKQLALISTLGEITNICERQRDGIEEAMNTTELAQEEPNLPKKILTKITQCEGLKVTLSGNRDDIVQFWQIINDIKQLCQEEINKQ